ncbi:hypothetical protein K523DRAFT_412894 [Schizophyllum commune Tattone D]|nr:hypothetical protein K523DRAFT_412894 [Schizophyllum commune Tattone D]
MDPAINYDDLKNIYAQANLRPEAKKVKPGEHLDCSPPPPLRTSFEDIEVARPVSANVHPRVVSYHSHALKMSEGSFCSHCLRTRYTKPVRS